MRVHARIGERRLARHRHDRAAELEDVARQIDDVDALRLTRRDQRLDRVADPVADDERAAQRGLQRARQLHEQLHVTSPGEVVDRHRVGVGRELIEQAQPAAPCATCTSVPVKPSRTCTIRSPGRIQRPARCAHVLGLHRAERKERETERECRAARVAHAHGSALRGKSSTPAPPYSTNNANNDRSMPRPRQQHETAHSEPSAAPAVFHNASRPAACASRAPLRRNAVPSSVNSTPESNEDGNTSGAATSSTLLAV